MKKMTCKAMGGTCEAEITGENAKEMMEAGKKHVHDATDGGDEGHKNIVTEMTKMTPEGHEKWASDFTAKFDGLEDA